MTSVPVPTSGDGLTWVPCLPGGLEEADTFLGGEADKSFLGEADKGEAGGGCFNAAKGTSSAPPRGTGLSPDSLHGSRSRICSVCAQQVSKGRWAPRSCEGLVPRHHAGWEPRAAGGVASAARGRAVLPGITGTGLLGGRALT